MNEDNILKSLVELEKALKEIDSAKRQVESTIESYKNVGVAVCKYSEGMSQVSKSLAEVASSLKGKQDSLARDLNQILNDAKSELKNQASNLNAEIGRVRSLDALITTASRDVSCLKNDVDVIAKIVRDDVKRDLTFITGNTGTVLNEVRRSKTILRVVMSLHLIAIIGIVAVIVLSFVR